MLMFNGSFRIFLAVAATPCGCHSGAMNQPSPRRRGGMAGGSLLALFTVGGVVVGTLYREPSIGFVTGLALGLLLVAMVWLLDRRRG